MIRPFKSERARAAVLASYDELLGCWGTPYEELDVPGSWGLTHCIRAGGTDRPPVVLLHGVGDNSAVMWVANMRDLALHYHCIAVDTLGGPGKSVPDGRYGRSFDQVRWLEEVGDALGLGCHDLVGVSNGAAMAFTFTVARPERVRKAVCIEGGMVVRPLAAMVRTLGLLFPEILVPTDRNMLRIMEKLCSPRSGIAERYPEVVRHMVLAMRTANRSAMFPHTPRKYDPEAARAVREKLYFLLGDHRIEGKRDFIDLLEQGGFRYSIVKDAGHALNHEQPEAACREITGFLGC